MKKGKTSQLRLFDNIKTHYGTVDAKKLRTIYVVLQSWVEPKDNYNNWKRIIGNLEREIKHLLDETIDKTIFDKSNIVDLSLRCSGIQKGKCSFMNLEITLFLKEHTDFKSIILRDKIKHIINNIYIYSLSNSKYFNLHRTKQKV